MPRIVSGASACLSFEICTWAGMIVASLDSVCDGFAGAKSIQDLMIALKQSAARFRQVMGPQSQRPLPPPTVTGTGLLQFCFIFSFFVAFFDENYLSQIASSPSIFSC